LFRGVSGGTTGGNQVDITGGAHDEFAIDRFGK
jgi:hypothetical protein